MEYMDMKPFKLAACSVAALAFGYVQAQEMSPATQATSPDSVGGVSATTSESGVSMGKTRAQVKQELQRARQSGELDRINAEYGGQ
jgi:ABC-type amino acid transport substrate-binding protein